MAKRQIARRKSKSGARPAAARYRAEDILKLIGAESEPVSWRSLTELASADHAKAITQLRQMLKGLQRSGELERDPSGAYHIPGKIAVETAIVTRQGRRLSAAGGVLEDAQRLGVREGDAVEVRVVGEQARLVRIISHADTPVTGILHAQGKYPYVEGIGSYRGRVSLTEPPVVGFDGETVRVRILDRDRRGLVGIVVDVVASDSVLEQAITTAISSGQIPDVWPTAVETQVARLPKSVAPNRFPKRVNLTEMPLVTIDGATAKDFDDAVFAEPLKGKAGGFRLVVAIADVGHYVKPGSALDQEAQARGTSVYFPERVVPMLPEVLSNGLCSLRPETPRLALVCDMRIDKDGIVKQFDFLEAVIFSHARLTYEQVQAHLDQNKPIPVNAKYDSKVRGSLGTLSKLHQAMQAAREKRGALDFATREADVVLNNGHVVAIEPVQRLRAHQLIEEAMIAANVAAASFLEAHHANALYRVHEPPDVDKLEELRQALAYIGVRLPGGTVTPAILQAALGRLPEHVDEWLISQLALRTLQQARYTPENRGHFGLALERYMHFTSPIRRYPDLVVHRAIKAVLAQRAQRPIKVQPSMDALVSLGEQCSSHERRAESAGWLVDAWLKCDYLRDRQGETLAGVVAGVTEFGLFVELEGYFVQGLLHISNLGQDYFHFEARSMALVGERSGRRFGLGDRLDVVIRDIDPPQGKIDLLLPGKPSSKKQDGSKQSGSQKRGSSGKKRGSKEHESLRKKKDAAKKTDAANKKGGTQKNAVAKKNKRRKK